MHLTCRYSGESIVDLPSYLPPTINIGENNQNGTAGFALLYTKPGGKFSKYHSIHYNDTCMHVWYRYRRRYEYSGPPLLKANL